MSGLGAEARFLGDDCRNGGVSCSVKRNRRYEANRRFGRRYAMLQPWFVLEFILSILSALRVFFRSRCDTALEVLALRQQVAVLKRKRPRPTWNSLDRLFWTLLHRCWSRWADVLLLVKPETVVGWHRAGFRLYWRWRSRPRGGRPKIDAEVRALIRRLANENASWGSAQDPRRTLKLGFVVSE